VIDNGSSDASTLETLQEARRAGVTVLEMSTPEAFEQKGRIISNFASETRDFDWIVPLDCDEILVTTDAGLGYSLDADEIRAEFRRLEATGKLIGRISHQFYNKPFSTGALPTAAEKVLIHARAEVELDKGFHLYDWGTNRPTVNSELIAPTAFAYIHFHNRPFDDLLARAREKLKLRVPDFASRTMASYRGDGQHLTKYFLMNAEAYGRSFATANISLEPLEEYGLSVPFSEPAKDVADRIAELKNPVNLEAHYDYSSATREELQEFLAQLRGVRTYLEFGAGGTTRVACEYGVQDVISIDTDLAHCERLIEHRRLRPFLDTRRLQLHHVDLGSVGDLGYPLEPPGEGQIDEYLSRTALAAGRQLVLVDGRYRVACCAALYEHVTETTVILLRDYFSRPSYEAVATLYEVTRRVDGMAILRKLDGRANAARRLLADSKSDPS
jgi:hypothetical protein